MVVAPDDQENERKSPMPGSPRPVRTVLAVIAVVGAVILSVVGLTSVSSLASPVGHPTKTARANATVTQTVTAYVTATATATVTKTVTAAPTSSAPTSSAPTSSAPTSSAPTSPTATASPTAWACTAQIGDACGAYQYPKIPMSNGYDTYVSNQAINVHGTETLTANSPGDWQVVANLADCGGCVQTYPDIQQLTNDWGGTTWNGGQDTPLDSLTTLKVNYAETSPASGASYEFSPDIWQTGYDRDIMFWVDTKGRCNSGAWGQVDLGHATIDGQGWTVHKWTDGEIIFVLDGPGGPGTCAQQSSGSINIKAGLEWLVAGGIIPAHPVLTQVNTGWEITQASNATFTVTDYSITAN
jgi:hypothetical protein